MKKTLFAIITTLVVIIGKAQNTHIDYKYAIKAYNTFAVNDNSVLSSGYINPSIAVQRKTKRNNFHEIEISDLKLVC